MGRVVTGLVLIIGVLFLARGFLSDIKKHQKPPTQYIIRDDTRIDDSQDSINVVNKNDFAWNNPSFVIKERYNYNHQGVFPPEGRLSIPFDRFKTSEGVSFTKDDMAYFEFDIRTATMARAR